VRTILLLYTDRAVRRVLERERPGRLVFASDDVTDADRRVFDETVVLPPVWEVEATLEALRRIRADEVFFQTEFGLLPGSMLARERGLPGPSPEAALACTSKWESRRLLSAAGVPVPAFGRCETAADVRRLGLGFPLVLKPMASTLGRGVEKVEHERDLDRAVDRVRRFLPVAPDVRRLAAFARAARLDLGGDPTRSFLVEAFASGPPREADGLVFGDRVDSFGVTEQVVRDGSGFYIEAYVFPARDPGRCAEHAAAAVRASGLRDTGYSAEFRGDVLIELNGRLGEDDGFPDLFAAGIGRAPVSKWLARDETPSRPRGVHALAYVNRYEAGVVRRVGPVPGGVVVTVEEGQRLPPPSDPAYRAHAAWTIEGDPRDAGLALDRARARLARLPLEIDDVPASAEAAAVAP
jgi:hypothetical protein